jgi:hypothetical protein
MRTKFPGEDLAHYRSTGISTSRKLRLFFHAPTGVFVIPESRKLRMPEMVGVSPFEKFNPRY